MSITPTKKIWMDGTFVDWPDATVHVLSHTLHYGTGAFEGIRAYKTPNGVAVFRLKEHMERLLRSCKILMIDVPYSVSELCEATKEIVRVNELHDGPVNTAIAAWAWGAYLGEEASLNGARMKISSWSRHHPNAMPTASKTIGGYVNASLAKVEAIKAGYDEALMLGPDGRVSEGTGENLFLVRDGKLVSPPPSEAGALQGITQASIVKIAEDLGYTVNFEALRRDDIYLADEAFVTGTAVEVVPLASVDDRLIGDGKPGPITKDIKTTFHQAVSGERPQYEDWLTRV
jgi:branched-chain amino acid aminotransferase